MSGSSTAVNKLIHDLNSGLSTIQQSLAILSNASNEKDIPTSKMMPLLLNKIEEVITNWGKVKEILKNRS